MKSGILEFPADDWISGVLAGTAGGLAEVAWIWIYEMAAGLDPAGVGKAISNIFGLGGAPMPATFGVAIHMALAIALGLAIAVAVKRPLRLVANPVLIGLTIIGVLALVWAVNFLLVLPRLSPAFATLVPYGVSLASKLLFGFSAAVVLWTRDRRHVFGEHL